MSDDSRPRILVDMVAQVVADTADRHAVMAVGAEAIRISVETGLSSWAVAAELIEAGREAQLAMELPTAEQLSFRPSAYESSASGARRFDFVMVRERRK